MSRLRVWLGLLWIASIAFGFALVLRHATEGEVALGTPAVWPASAPVELAAGRPTLVMFAQPSCPCTRASLRQLERLLARAGDRVAAHMLMAQRRGGPGASETALWAEAGRVRGLRVASDEEGQQAARFGARRSGHVVLYDSAGRLLFAGGITPARGHEGSSEGLDALDEAIFGRTVRGALTRVFGCTLPEGS